MTARTQSWSSRLKLRPCVYSMRLFIIPERAKNNSTHQAPPLSSPISLCDALSDPPRSYSYHCHHAHQPAPGISAFPRDKRVTRAEILLHRRVGELCSAT